MRGSVDLAKAWGSRRVPLAMPAGRSKGRRRPQFGFLGSRAFQVRDLLATLLPWGPGIHYNCRLGIGQLSIAR
jgi:hypothetical protein